MDIVAVTAITQALVGSLTFLYLVVIGTRSYGEWHTMQRKAEQDVQTPAGPATTDGRGRIVRLIDAIDDHMEEFLEIAARYFRAVAVLGGFFIAFALILYFIGVVSAFSGVEVIAGVIAGIGFILLMASLLFLFVLIMVWSLYERK